MANTNRANLGDIIRSERFAFGFLDSTFDAKGNLIPIYGTITVDGRTKERPVQYFRPGTSLDNKIEKGIVELGAYDESRGLARFVVERAEMEGGGTGQGPYDTYPDGWHVQARRLNEDGTYNPNGELVQFYQSGYFNCLIPSVEVLGRMRLTFIKDD